MNRLKGMFFGTAVISAVIGIGLARGDGPKSQETRAAPSSQKSSDTNNQSKGANPQQADEDAIRETGESYLKAYEMGDAKRAAEHFTADAEYVDEFGTAHQGRKAIEAALNQCFEESPGSRLELDIDSIRVIGPGVALEDGHISIVSDSDRDPIRTRYTAVHVKADGKWQVASVRERAPAERRAHRSQLQQLAWLQGEWLDQDRDATVRFFCAPVDNGNFLLREFSIELGGEHVMSGSQRIGWDPLSRKLRTWIFDSDGGYGEGFWIRDDDRWILKAIGITSDGQMASGTAIYRPIDEHTMTWQSVDREIGGVRWPDSDVVRIVRRAAPPQLEDELDLKKSDQKQEAQTNDAKSDANNN